MCLKVQNDKKQISHKCARRVSITAVISSGANCHLYKLANIIDDLHYLSHVGSGDLPPPQTH